MSPHLSLIHISSSAPCFQTPPSLRSPPLMSETKFHSHTEPEAKYSLVYSNLCFDSNREDRRFWTEW
jgi:hypothetical protein